VSDTAPDEPFAPDGTTGRARPLAADGAAGRKVLQPQDVPYFEVAWIESHEAAPPTYDLLGGGVKKLDSYVTRITARNAGVMTGPGTNTYLVGEHELAVIDPGPAEPAHVKAILAAGAGRIRWVICTHTHPDHASAAYAISEASGAPLAGRPGSVTDHDVPVVFDRVLADGDAVEFDGIVLRVLHTPGHASNHVCLRLEQTGMLFTGDHIIQGSTVVIWPPDGNMHAYLESLRRLAATPSAVLAPGHGFLIGRPDAAAERLIRHRLAREDKVRKALAAAGPGTSLEALLGRVYDDVPVGIHPIAAHSLLAHLEKLMGDGEVARSDGRYELL
jgi:glyoxylase-like metal-dependent hydrolase (beta-lactamase superfamily II)